MSALLYIKNLFKRQEGQTLVEYALIIFLVSIVAAVALTALGGRIVAVFNAIVGSLGG